MAIGDDGGDGLIDLVSNGGGKLAERQHTRKVLNQTELAIAFTQIRVRLFEAAVRSAT